MSTPPTGSAKPCILVAAGRADWEPAVLKALAGARMVVLRRCVDVVDLVATASTGSADAAVVAADLEGIDTESLRRLRVHGVGVLAVGGDADQRERLTRLGVATTGPGGVVEAVRAQMDRRGPSLPPRRAAADAAAAADTVAEPDRPPGRVVAVWGPAGAPGRSTVAAAIAAERALTGRVVLADVDPYGGTLAQGLGVLDEISGLLFVARAANEGTLDQAALRTALRTVAPGLDLLTGLPRPDRWVEVRPGVLESLVGTAAAGGDVVLDCGFGIGGEDAGTGSPGRLNAEVLAVAERIVVVGSAEPVALSRLARSLVRLRDAVAPAPGALRVVVNRMRASLGWRASDITAMVAEVAPGARVSFWPYERAALDRAALRGVALTELGETPLRDCARALLAGLFESAAQVPNNR